MLFRWSGCYPTKLVAHAGSGTDGGYFSASLTLNVKNATTFSFKSYTATRDDVSGYTTSSIIADGHTLWSANQFSSVAHNFNIAAYTTLTIEIVGYSRNNTDFVIDGITIS